MKNHPKRNNPPISRPWLVLAILLLVSLAFAACNPALETPQAENPTPIPMELLYRSSWVLIGYGDPASLTVMPPGVEVTAAFTPEGGLSGSSGCNQYSTTFTASSDGSMTIQPEIASTMMFCEGSQNEVEQAYLAALPTVKNFRFNEQGRLELSALSPEGQEIILLYISGQGPLSNTSWTLTSYGDPANPQPVPGGVVITALFSSDGIVSGSAGCNSYTAGYTTTDNNLTVEPIATTMMFCESGMEAEQAYTAALQQSATYLVAGPTLTITALDGTVLIYSSLNLPLENTLWTLTTLAGSPVPASSAVTATFQPGAEAGKGDVSGLAGCNQYFGDYELADGQVKISPLGSTRMMCEEELMTLEQSYLAALEAANGYQVNGATLQLSSELGTMVFIANRTPLTGALWLLTALGDVNDPQPPVEGSQFSAQFTRNPDSPTGVLTGSTGCNEYAAVYAASLTEIKINAPANTGSQTCVPGLIEQENLYYLALADASTYSIIGNTLFIPYDSGKQALVFEGTQLGLANFEPIQSLDGTYWYLWTLNDQPVVNGTSITADFSVDAASPTGAIQGSAGCNLYQATFGDGMGMQTTLNAGQTCTQPAGVMEQETSYIQVLGRVFGYWLTGDQLILNSGLGTLTYRTTPAPQSSDQAHLLQAHPWFLVSYNTTLSAPGSQGNPGVTFNQDGTLTGYTGCNSISGSYQTNLNQLTTSNLASTKAACPNNVLSDQERAMMEVLTSAQTYQVIDTSLQIVGGSGVLNFFVDPVTSPETAVPPQSVLTAPAVALVGQAVTFDASKSTAQVPITSFRWDFGDGGRGNGATVQHTYQNVGRYFVQMTVTDQRGYQDSSSMYIEIIASSAPTPTPTTVPPEPTPTPTSAPDEPTPEPEPTQAPEQPTPEPEPTQAPEAVPPVAAISGPGNGFPGEVVFFDASGSQPGSSPIASFSWSFGDGASAGPSANVQASTIYNHSGTYQVTVTVADENGLSSSASTQVNIQARLDTAVWTLDNIDNQMLVPGTTITLQFLNGQIAGFGGCNSYNGAYSATDNGDGTYSVQVTQITNTQMACPEEVMRQEQRYFEILSQVTTAQVQGNYLVLASPVDSLAFYEVGSPMPR